jgi:hypothetical protein
MNMMDFKKHNDIDKIMIYKTTFFPSFHILMLTPPSYLLLFSIDVDIRLNDDVDSKGQKMYLEVVSFLFFDFLLPISDVGVNICVG